jgi:hypothetical protein
MCWLKLPDMHDYPAGYHRYSLLEVSPLSGKGFSEVKRVEAKGAVGFEAKLSGRIYTAMLDLGSRAATLRVK